MPRKVRGKGTRRAGGKDLRQGFKGKDLNAKLAETMRWREMEWSRIPPLSRKLVMPYLTARDIINLDIAVTDKEERKHLVKAYVGRSAGLDGYAHYKVDEKGKCLGTTWAQKRSIDLHNFRLEYFGVKDDQDKVLRLLVQHRRELATYFATKCDVRDMKFCGISTLLLASMFGYLEIVQALLGRSMKGHIEVVRALLSAGADVSKSDNADRAALHFASREGHIEVVRALLEARTGVDVRKCDEDGISPITYASWKKNIELYVTLVEAGGEVDKLDSDGWTVLHDASQSGFIEGVRYLLGRGADVNKSASNVGGHTPLTLASYCGRLEVVRALLEAGASVDKRDGEDETPLSRALMVKFWHTKRDRVGKVKVAVLLTEVGKLANISATRSSSAPN